MNTKQTISYKNRRWKIGKKAAKYPQINLLTDILSMLRYPLIIDEILNHFISSFECVLLFLSWQSFLKFLFTKECMLYCSSVVLHHIPTGAVTHILTSTDKECLVVSTATGVLTIQKQNETHSSGVKVRS